jgi:4-hydroxybenzoate polyprenyltransferase
MHTHSRASALLAAIRPHQWVKNLLVFLPLLASHSFGAGDLWRHSALAFAAFCLLASAGYLLNDLLDIEADRAHPSKRLRPIAAGRLGVLSAAAAMALAGFGGIALAWVFSPALGAVASGYGFLTMAYSRWLKRVPFLDVAVLALLYTLRLWAGSAVTGIWPSPWLSGFSLSLFVSLALCKRYIEYNGREDAAYSRRGYLTSHLPAIRRAGLAALFLAVGILAAYLSSRNITVLYARPLVLAGAVAILAAWGIRIWKLAAKGKVDDDPVQFALTDWVSWAALVGLGVVFAVAM